MIFPGNEGAHVLSFLRKADASLSPFVVRRVVLVYLVYVFVMMVENNGSILVTRKQTTSSSIQRFQIEMLVFDMKRARLVQVTSVATVF